MIRDDVMAMATALLFLITLAPPVLYLAHRYRVLWPATFALVTRLVWGFTHLWLLGLAASDAAVYDAEAQRMAEGEENVRLASGKEAWPTLLSFIYSRFGHSPEAGLVLNAVVAASLPIVIVLVCRAFGWNTAEKPAAWLVAAFPATIPWTSLLLRESFIALLLALMLLGAAWVRSGKILPGLTLLLGSTGLMLSFRGGLAFIGAAVLPAILLVGAVFGKDTPMRTRLAAPVAGGIILVLLLPTLSDLADKASYFDEERRVTVAESLDRGSTATGKSEEIADSADTPGEGWLRGVKVLPLTSFGPMPWSWRNPQLIVVGMDGLMWLGVWAMVVVGFRSCRRKMDAVLGVAPALLLLIYVGTAGTNLGLVMRMRALGIPLLAPVAGLGIAIAWQSWRQHKAPSAPTTSQLDTESPHASQHPNSIG